MGRIFRKREFMKKLLLSVVLSIVCVSLANASSEECSYLKEKVETLESKLASLSQPQSLTTLCMSGESESSLNSCQSYASDINKLSSGNVFLKTRCQLDFEPENSVCAGKRWVLHTELRVPPVTAPINPESQLSSFIK